MKLLIIEDNRALVQSLKDFLAKDFVIEHVGTAKEGLQLASTTGVDVIVLDLGLPDASGSDVCREVRAANINTPILVLSTMGSVQNRVDLLNLGADDYIVKPFSRLELRARLFSLLRRIPTARTTSLLDAANIVMDLNGRRAYCDGTEIMLRRKEFDILEYLIRNSGQVVTRSMIFDHIWESNKDCWHNTVDVHIKHLRDKIDRPFNTQCIKTVYGVGYVFDDRAIKIP